MAHPWIAVIGVSAVLLFLAIPLLSMTTGTEAINQFPKGSDVRVGNELASKQLGGGADPVQIVAEFEGREPRDRAAVAGFVARLEATPGVSSVAPPAFAGDSVLFQATPSAPSESDAAIGAGRAAARQRRPAHRAGRGRDRRRRRRDRSQPRRPRARSAARCGRSSSSSSRSASSS